MYYNVNEVADLLGFTPETVRRKIHKGEITAFKVRDKYKIRKEEVRKYMENNIKDDTASDEDLETIVSNLLDELKNSV